MFNGYNNICATSRFWQYVKLCDIVIVLQKGSMFSSLIFDKICKIDDVLQAFISFTHRYMVEFFNVLFTNLRVI